MTIPTVALRRCLARAQGELAPIVADSIYVHDNLRDLIYTLLPALLQQVDAANTRAEQDVISRWEKAAGLTG